MKNSPITFNCFVHLWLFSQNALYVSVTTEICLISKFDLFTCRVIDAFIPMSVTIFPMWLTYPADFEMNPAVLSELRRWVGVLSPRTFVATEDDMMLLKR